jgi:hypothetical protein
MQKAEKMAPKPLFRDPVYDGAADPVVIWNQKERKWFMFYTNRRANIEGLDGVTWVHGTRIGIAESSEGGLTWQYRDTCDIQYRFGEYRHWAPDGNWRLWYNNEKDRKSIYYADSPDLYHWEDKGKAVGDQSGGQ